MSITQTKQSSCLFFIDHMHREDWLDVERYVCMWEQVEAMKLGYVEAVCSHD